MKLRRDLGVLALCLASAGCERVEDFLLCSTEVESSILSPDGAYLASTFHRECGATTNFNTQVTIRAAHHSFDPRVGRIFAVDGRRTLILTWRSRRDLVIPMPDDTVYEQLTSWNDVAIHYEPSKAP